MVTRRESAVSNHGAPILALSFETALARLLRMRREIRLTLAVVRAPVAPADIGEAAEVRAKRALGRALVSRDAFLGLGDLALQLGHRFCGGTAPVMAAGEARDLERFQRLAVLLQLRAMPGNPAVAVRHSRSLAQIP